MNILAFVPLYLAWHYSRGIREIAAIVARLEKMLLEAFSVKALLRTFFTPWRRIGEEYDKRNPSQWLGTFIVNTLMRFIGVLVRTGILVFGVILVVLGIILGIALLLLWLIAPAAVVGLLVMGIKELIT